jgi:integrase
MSRADLCRVGKQNVKAGRISYRRAKTGVPADLPILPELAQELDLLPADQLLFIVQDNQAVGYTPATLGNWFRKRCKEAGVPGSLHGLRKAGATRLANAGANPDEIKAFLAHATNAQGARYTQAADRGKQADRGFAKLANVSNLSDELDRKEGKASD